MLPVDDHRVGIASLIVDANDLLEELLIDRCAYCLAIHARAHLTKRERFKRLTDGQAIRHLIRLIGEDLHSLAVCSQSCLFVGCVHLLDDLSRPSETGITSPSVPSLSTFAVLVPCAALLIDLMSSEVGEHPANGLRRERLACDQVSCSSDADCCHTSLRLRLVFAPTQSALGCFACALRRLEIDVVIFLRREQSCL